MLPVLYHFVFTSGLAQVLLYVFSAGLLAYAGWTGWHGAVGDFDPKRGVRAAATQNQRLQRMLMHLVVVGVLLKVGLGYALPAGAFLGEKGEGIPIHTYGLLLALGFLLALKVTGRLAEREWSTLEGPPAALLAWLDAANAAIRDGKSPPVLSPELRGYQAFFRHAKDGQLSLPRDFNLEGARKKDQMMDLAFWALVGGIGGSKLLFILVNWQDYGPVLGELLGGLFTLRLGQAAGALTTLVSGGLVFYGGLLGAAGLCLWWARRSGLDFLRVADVAIPTVSLGQALGRLGCFSAGCCWGGTTHADHPLAVQFPGAGNTLDLLGQASKTPSLAYSSMARDGRYVVEATGEVVSQAGDGVVRISEWVLAHGQTLPVFATQLVESVGQLAIFVLLVSARRWRRFHGMIFAIWLMAYAVLRTSVELFRGDVERGTLHGLLSSLGLEGVASAVPLEAWYNISTSQFISLCLFGLGVALLWTRWNSVPAPSLQPPADPDAPAEPAVAGAG